MNEIDFLLRLVKEERVSGSAVINPFWIDQLADFQTLLDETERPTTAQMRSALRYNDSPLPEGVISNRQLSDWPDIEKRVAEHKAGNLSTAVAEHVGALITLKMHQLIEKYIDTIDAIRLQSSMTLARHFWYTRHLQKYMAETSFNKPSSFLEIGAGGGQFLQFIARTGLAQTYVVVDLPPMLINCIINMRQFLPEAKIFFNKAPVSSSGKDLSLYFIDPAHLSLIADDSVDVCVNFNSFMEMDREVRDRYFYSIYTVIRNGGLFYNVNRRQAKMTLKNGSLYDNNPLLYPYCCSDEILEWGPDEFQQNYRSRDFKSAHTSFCVSRISVVNKLRAGKNRRGNQSGSLGKSDL